MTSEEQSFAIVDGTWYAALVLCVEAESEEAMTSATTTNAVMKGGRTRVRSVNCGGQLLTKPVLGGFDEGHDPQMGNSSGPKTRCSSPFSAPRPY